MRTGRIRLSSYLAFGVQDKTNTHVSELLQSIVLQSVAETLDTLQKSGYIEFVSRPSDYLRVR